MITMYDMNAIIYVTPGLLAVFSLLPACQPSFIKSDYGCKNNLITYSFIWKYLNNIALRIEYKYSLVLFSNFLLLIPCCLEFAAWYSCTYCCMDCRYILVSL